jgi:hypothetical protein
MQIVPCDTKVDASVNFGGTMFKISPETFNLGPMASNPNRCMGGFAALPLGFGKQHFLAVPQRVSYSTGFWTFGTVFLENVYAKFDVGRKEICFGLPA